MQPSQTGFGQSAWALAKRKEKLRNAKTNIDFIEFLFILVKLRKGEKTELL